MTTPRRISEQRPETYQKQPGAVPTEESLGEQIMREALESHGDFVAGWRQFMDELGIHGKPIGAKKLREMAIEDGFNPNDNEFSQGIIAMREE